MKLFRQTFGTGEPLVIIHGLMGASGNWQTLAKNYFGACFKTITLDLRNHGRSPHSESNSYADMAADVLELMEEEGIDHAHILGHSMGGKLAMHLALEHGEMVDKLIVADIAPRAYQRRHDPIFQALQAVDLQKINHRDQVDSAIAKDIPDARVRQFLLKNLMRENGRFTWGMNLSVIEREYEWLIGEIEAWEIFEGDALFVRGQKSDYILDSDFIAIRALFPFAQFETIPDAGHWLHAEAPETFAQMCLDFLR